MTWDIVGDADGTFSIQRSEPDGVTVYTEIASEDVALDYVSQLYAHLHFPDGVAGEQADAPSGANAPYKIQKRDGKYVVVNNAGAVKSTFDDRDKALAYLRALYSQVPGAAKRASKVKFTGKAKDRVKAATR